MNVNMNGGTIAPAANSGSSPHSHSSASNPGSSTHSFSAQPAAETYSSSSNSSSSARPAASGSPGASIPINLYKELAAELQHTQEQLKTMSDRHETLAQQNQQLRAEIAQLVRAVLQARYAANTLQPEAPIMPELDAALGQGRAEQGNSNPLAQNQSLEDALAAAIAQQASMMPPGTAASSTHHASAHHGEASSLADALLIQSGPRTGSIKMPSHPRPMGTTQSHASHSNMPERSASTPVFRGWGVVAVVVMVIVTGFGMGFATTLWLQHRSSSSAS